MNIKQIHYFLAIREQGGFSSAAEALYLSQSSLSKQMMALEKTLGVTLFDRGKRQIALTPAGEVFAQYALQFNETYQAMTADLAEFRPVAKTVALVAIPVIAQYGVPLLLAQFRRRYPAVSLTLQEQEAAAILPLLDSHQFDLALVRDYGLDRAQYAGLDIAEDRLVTAVSTQHSLAYRTAVSLSELADEPFILFDKGTLIHEMSLAACRQAGFEPNIIYTSSRVESVVGLVAAQSGVALIMEKVLAHVSHPGVVAVPLQEPIESKVVLVYLKSRKLSPAAKCFVDFMQSKWEVG